jgi:hypothetical protein
MYFKKIFVLFLVFSIILLSITACAAHQGTANTSSSDNKGVTIPQPDYPKKQIPSMDGKLRMLIVAGSDAESFARSRGMGDDVIDGKVRVQIEAMPGQLDVAANITAAIGTVEVIARKLNMFDAVVPLTSLEALANESSIRYISLPEHPVAE